MNHEQPMYQSWYDTNAVLKWELEYKLPPLKGTTKQVEYARDIRNKILSKAFLTFDSLPIERVKEMHNLRLLNCAGSWINAFKDLRKEPIEKAIETGYVLFLQLNEADRAKKELRALKAKEYALQKKAKIASDTEKTKASISKLKRTVALA